MKNVARSIRIRGAAGTVRNEVLNSRNHMVVPVVALMEGVVWPSNAPSPEFVPASTLEAAPSSWNGRICVPNHPTGGDGADAAGSANTRQVIETQAFGTVLNTFFDDKKLKMEAWLDVEKAKALGGLPANVIERLENGQPIEVSVGAFVHLEDKPGSEWNGKKFESQWSVVIPDHLALLPQGVEGACSNKMGCGAPRTARVHVLSGGGYEVACEHEGEPTELETVSGKKRSLKERFAALTSFFRRSQELSNEDISYKLAEATRNVEPGFYDVWKVYMESLTYVYMCYTEDTDHLYRRSFAVDGMEVTIGDDRVEVQPIVSFEPIAASGCACGGICDSCKETHHMKTKAERVLALIASKKTKYTDADKTRLEALSEEQITLIEEALPTDEAPVPTPTPAPTPVAAAAAPVPTPEPVKPEPKTAEQIEAEYLAAAPPSVKDIVAQHKAREAARRTELIGALKTKQKTYTEERLNGMALQQLEEIASLVSVPSATIDYSGAPPRQNAETLAVPAPPDMVANIRAAKK